MQIKHVDKRLNDREKYVRAIKNRTLAVMICAIVTFVLYTVCYICAAASYGYIASEPSCSMGSTFFILNFVKSDVVAQNLLSAWSVTWLIYLIVSIPATIYTIVNLALLLRASTKMARRYNVVKIRGWFIMLLVFAAATLAYMIIDLGLSSAAYADSASSAFSADLNWIVAGPCETINSWLNNGSTAGWTIVVLIPLATMVLAIVQWKVGKKYIKTLYDEKR